uniref:Uncharacterized protein n=1 Tax=Arundo donax TaxID=35708 RepID=A0A0A9BFI2_ARUDO
MVIFLFDRIVAPLRTDPQQHICRFHQR